MKKKIIITFQHTESVSNKANELFNVVPTHGRRLSSEEIIQLSNYHQVDALLVSHGQQLDKDTLNQLPANLKIIATSSVGYDHLDIDTAKERNIILTNTPRVLNSATATLTMMLILNVSRRASEYMKIMENGWRKTFGQSEMLGQDLDGKTLAILGMGEIGQDLAKKAKAFGMKVIYCNRNQLPNDLEDGAIYYKNFKDMLPHADVLSLHAPATKDTFHMMNHEAFSLLKKTAILINVGRGNLVDENALHYALQNNHIFGAGLDVFESEPDFDKNFLNYPNVFLTPHMGSATIETRNAMGLLALENIQLVLEGKEAKTRIGN